MAKWLRTTGGKDTEEDAVKSKTLHWALLVAALAVVAFAVTLVGVARIAWAVNVIVYSAVAVVPFLVLVMMTL